MAPYWTLDAQRQILEEHRALQAQYDTMITAQRPAPVSQHGAGPDTDPGAEETTRPRDSTLYYIVERYSQGDGWQEVSRYASREAALAASPRYQQEHPELSRSEVRVLHLALVEGAY